MKKWSWSHSLLLQIRHPTKHYFSLYPVKFFKSLLVLGIFQCWLAASVLPKYYIEFLGGFGINLAQVSWFHRLWTKPVTGKKKTKPGKDAFVLLFQKLSNSSLTKRKFLVSWGRNFKRVQNNRKWTIELYRQHAVPLFPFECLVILQKYIPFVK